MYTVQNLNLNSIN